MTMEFGWRRFYFFDKSFVNETSSSGEKDKFLGLKDVKVQSWCQSGDMVFLCEPDGGVFRLNSRLEVCVWKAFHRSHRTQNPGDDNEEEHHSDKEEKRKPIAMTDIQCAQGFLFALGEDDDSGPLLKMWGKIGEEPPELKKTIKLSQTIPGLLSTATALGVHSLLTDVAVGFSDGSVIIYQGDVAKDKLFVQMSRWMRIREPSGSEGAVEGLAIAHLPGDKVVVFVVLTNALYSYVIEGKTVVNKVKHISSGATKDCWSFNEHLGQLAVASKEVVNIFDAERSLEVDGGQGRCYTFYRGHEKLQLLWAGEYLVLLTKQHPMITSTNSLITIYDIKGQYAAFSCSLPDLCKMFILNGILVVRNDKDGTLSELKEKSLTARIDILFKKKFFDVALNLAKNSKDGQSHLQMIHWKYGDHLFLKCEYDQAINQYKETIGLLEPSYVMKKFHEETRLQQLCVYLEALHERKVHNCHQTEILLRTYARLGQKSKLLAFVEKIAGFEEGADLPTAFQIMRDAKMSKEASFLAVKLKLHKEALVTMIDDLGKYTTAVKYIGQQPPEISSPMIEKYGRTLLEHCPNETIQLIYTLLGSYNESDEISRLITPFLDILAFQKEFVQFVLNTLPKPRAKSLADNILELRLRKLNDGVEPTDSDWDDLFALADAATPEIALQLVRVFRCLPMEHKIMQKSGRWKEFAQFLLKHGELKELIDICKTKGGTDLWMQTVACVAQRTDLSDQDIKGFLHELEQTEALHPLLVLEVLSSSDHLKISAVKEYVINWLQRMNAQIELDSKSVEAKEKEMEEVSRQVESLKFEPQVIRVNKCCACASALQLPAVHFLCKHSYHVHCFESYSDNLDRCPACANAEQQEQINEGIETLDMGQRSEYGKFQSQMNSSVNGMDVLAKYLKMGIFDSKPAPPPKQGSASKPSGSNPFAEALLKESEASDADRNPLNEPPRRRSTITKRPPAPARSSASTNPFDEDEAATSTSSKNPFEKPSTKNPFESKNPFDDE